MIESVEEYVALFESEDYASQMRMRHDTAPVSVWEEILSRHPDLKRCVTHNKKLPEPVLRRLAEDEDHMVRSDVAMKRGLPADLFAALAGDPHECVRSCIALNRKTPEEVLRRLLSDPMEFVAESARERLRQRGK